MFKTLKNAWRIPELRKKLMFTVIILLLYRIGNVIPVPFVDTLAMKEYQNTVEVEKTVTDEKGKTVKVTTPSGTVFHLEVLSISR